MNAVGMNITDAQILDQSVLTGLTGGSTVTASQAKQNKGGTGKKLALYLSQIVGETESRTRDLLMTTQSVTFARERHLFESFPDGRI